jgi:hypothetical protein
VAHVRLITVALTLGSFLHNGGRLSAADTSLLSRIVQLAPAAFVILRVSLAGGARLGMEMNTLMSATNGSTIPCGCSWAKRGGEPNGTDDCASPTAAWAKAAGLQLQRLLRAADVVIPGKLAGVQLVGLSTGEWELPHDDFVYTNGTFDCRCRRQLEAARARPTPISCVPFAMLCVPFGCSASHPDALRSHPLIDPIVHGRVARAQTSPRTRMGWLPSGAQAAASRMGARCRRRWSATHPTVVTRS